MSNLTPIGFIAASGLLKGRGLAVNKELVSAINQFSNQGTSGAIRNLLLTASDEIKAQLEFAPSFLTGFFPNGVQIPDGVNKYDLAGEIKKSANSLISDGIPKFAVIFSQALLFSSISFTAHGELAQVKAKNFEDYGFQFNNFQDMLTGGVSSQFDSDTIVLLSKEFPNLGTMFNISDLSRLWDPRSLCGNLLRQGLGYVGNLRKKLVDAGIDLNNLEDADISVVNSILNTIEENDIEIIQATTGFKPYKSLCCLEEALQISYLFSPKIAFRIGSLKNLSDKLTNVGGNFSDFNQLAAFYGSIEVGNFPNLNKLKVPAPDQLLLDLVDKTNDTRGTGSGPFNNPRITDIIGTVAGIGYVDDLLRSADMQKKLIDHDPQVLEFYNYIKNTSNPDPNRLSTIIQAINSKESLQNVLNTFNLKMLNSASRLTTELSNRKSAKIDPATITATDSDVNDFIDQLSSIATDNLGLGSSLLIARMATDDVYGEAIVAYLQETRNLNRLEAVNITVTNKMDAMAYAKQLRSMI